MSILKLYPILIHPLLLSPAPKCLHKHQYCRDQSGNYSLIILIVYLQANSIPALRPIALLKISEEFKDFIKVL
jgi:hypothetical protein